MRAEQVEALLRELCVDLGFCLPFDAYEQLVDNPPRTADAFARKVFEAEGLDFDTYPHTDIRQAVEGRIAKQLTASSAGEV